MAHQPPWPTYVVVQPREAQLRQAAEISCCRTLSLTEASLLFPPPTRTAPSYNPGIFAPQPRLAHTDERDAESLNPRLSLYKTTVFEGER